VGGFFSEFFLFCGVGACLFLFPFHKELFVLFLFFLSSEHSPFLWFEGTPPLPLPRDPGGTSFFFESVVTPPYSWRPSVGLSPGF